MRRHFILIFLAALLQTFFINHQSLAQTEPQDTTSLYRVEMKDGNEFLGTIVSQEAGVLRLRTQNMGILTLNMQDIKAMTQYNVSKVKDGKLWFDNPQATRYFFAPNAYGLKKGEGYYQNVLLFVNQASVGITDNISIGAGIVPLFLFAGTSSPIWLLPKVSVPVVKDKFNIGGGALIGTVLGEGTSFGIAYGLTTFGSRDRNLTMGLGYGYADGGWASSPTITASALIRTGNRGYIISENYFIGTSGGHLGLLALGGRRIIKNVGLDFGLFSPFESGIDQFFAFPFLGLTVPFGKN